MSDEDKDGLLCACDITSPGSDDGPGSAPAQSWYTSMYNHGGKKWGIGESHSQEIYLLVGNSATWREILVNEIKKYVKNGGKFGYTEGKFWTIFPGNVAFFPAVRIIRETDTFMSDEDKDGLLCACDITSPGSDDGPASVPAQSWHTSM